MLTIQENLHLALARLAEAIQEQVHSVSSKPFAEEILRGPRGGQPPERYYEPATRKVKRVLIVMVMVIMSRTVVVVVLVMVIPRATHEDDDEGDDDRDDSHHRTRPAQTRPSAIFFSLFPSFSIPFCAIRALRVKQFNIPERTSIL